MIIYITDYIFDWFINYFEYEITENTQVRWAQFHKAHGGVSKFLI